METTKDDKKYLKVAKYGERMGLVSHNQVILLIFNGLKVF